MSVVVLRKGQRLKVVKGRNVRSVSLARVSRRAFWVRVQLRTSGSGGKARTVTLTRRVAGC